MRFLIIMGCALTVGIAGCQQPVSNQTVTVQDDPSSQSKKKRDEYLAALKADMQKADEEMEVLRKKAAAATGEAKEAMQKKLKELESHRSEVHINFDKIKSESHETFEKLKDGMDRSWNALKDSIHRAKKDFE